MGERKKRHIHNVPNQVASCGYVNKLEHSFWGKYAESCGGIYFFHSIFLKEQLLV